MNQIEPLVRKMVHEGESLKFILDCVLFGVIAYQLTKCRGNQTATAKVLKCSKDTTYQRIYSDRAKLFMCSPVESSLSYREARRFATEVAIDEASKIEETLTLVAERLDCSRTTVREHRGDWARYIKQETQND